MPCSFIPFSFKISVHKNWVIVEKGCCVGLLMLTALLMKGATWTLTKEVKNTHSLASIIVLCSEWLWGKEKRLWICPLCGYSLGSEMRAPLSWISHQNPVIFFLLITQFQSPMHIITEIVAFGYERRGDSWCLVVLTTCKFWKLILTSVQREWVGVLQGCMYSSP